MLLILIPVWSTIVLTAWINGSYFEMNVPNIEWCYSAYLVKRLAWLFQSTACVFFVVQKNIVSLMSMITFSIVVAVTFWKARLNVSNKLNGSIVSEGGSLAGYTKLSVLVELTLLIVVHSAFVKASFLNIDRSSFAAQDILFIGLMMFVLSMVLTIVVRGLIRELQRLVT